MSSVEAVANQSVAPQGTVLALFLFTLYNADFSYSSSSCHLQKFSDDSAAVGLITDGDDTERNNLPPAPVNILGTDDDVVKRLRSFGVQGPLLRTFYDSVVGSAIFYGIACWSSSITDRDSWRMDRLVRRASSVLGCPLDSVEVVGNGRLMAKLSSMLNNTSHPLQDTLTALGSSFSEWLLHPRCVKERSVAPQGTVLALFLFTLYNADFSYSSSSCHLQKFSDDSAAVGLITDGDDTEYRGLIQDFVDWSLRNNLRINANKTKELVVDLLRRNNLPPAPVNILKS
ncbi:hypothetical protein D4764_14G0005810 [Takifugu flavidus]|uniref:Reverse transcriptase domain-containing protein n=1 Tax=Takifugu flavidus TaxID=433684 RepID=A0A5C6P6X7_9TELE|nr:hypothetical protein D4764_14G0005810 [Takifugu flavidus]